MLAIQHSTYATKPGKKESKREKVTWGEGEILLTGELCKTLINSLFFFS